MEQNKEKKKRNEDSLRDTQRFTLQGSQKEKREKEPEKIFDGIIAENSLTC